MQDAMLQYMRVGFSAQALRNIPAPRVGNKLVSGANPPCGLYPCKPFGPNDYVCIYTSHNNPGHWRSLLAVIGRSDLVGDARYDTQAARVEREAEVDELLSAWSRQHDKFEAERLLGSAGVPAGAVRDTQELMNDSHFEGRGVMQVMQHPKNGAFKMPAWPVLHDGRPPSTVSPSPLLGEQGSEILQDWLGLGDEDVSALREGRVIA